MGLWLLLMFASMVLAGGAQLAVKGAFEKYRKVRASSNLTGAQAAREMLRSAGIHDVRVERSRGMLSDHYDPRSKVIRLSEGVHDSRSVAALGIACHEAGHAVQDARNYAFLVVRNAAVPMASVGSNLSVVLIFIGIFLMMMQAAFGQFIAYIGILLFAGVVLFQIVNLPVEFDASARAKRLMPQLGMISGPREKAGVNAVLNAAAMTYVAAAVSSILTLLYYLMVFYGGARD